jgi:hypothetical protein
VTGIGLKLLEVSSFVVVQVSLLLELVESNDEENVNRVMS